MKPIYDFSLSAIFILLVGPCILTCMFDIPFDYALLQAVYSVFILLGVFHECILWSDPPCSLCYIFEKRPFLSWILRCIHYAMVSSSVVELGISEDKCFITLFNGLALQILFLARSSYCMTLPEWNGTKQDADEGNGEEDTGDGKIKEKEEG